jgi:dipeptidase E
MSDPTIVAMGGGGFSMEPDNPLLDDHVLGLARASRGRERPRVCFLATASGDAPTYIAEFYAAFARRAEASHLALFVRTVDDVDGFLYDQDVIYVGGGNTENMMAIWRLHGVDRALRRAWESGVVMTGVSAGSLCWFETGTTDSFGPRLAALSGGLGFVPGSHAPHYDGEPTRRPHYQRLVAEGALPAGYAADDGAALVFRGMQLTEVVASRPDARAYRVERGAGGDVVETELPTRFLG